MSSLGKDIGGRGPSKKQINLIVTEKAHGNVGKTVGAVFLAVAVLAAAGFYVLTRMQTVGDLQMQLWDAQDQLVLLQGQSSEYDEVSDAHLRYSFAHLTKAEKNTRTGMMIIEKIEELVVPYGFVTEMTISGNSVDFTVYSEDIELVTSSLRSDPAVQKVIPKSESKQESTETITVKENVSAMIMKTIGGVQVIKRSDDPVPEEETAEGETAEGEAGTAEEGAEKKQEADTAEDGKTGEETASAEEAGTGEEAVYLNTEKVLEEGPKDVEVTIVIPPVMSVAQLTVTFRDLEGN